MTAVDVAYCNLSFSIKTTSKTLTNLRRNVVMLISKESAECLDLTKLANALYYSTPFLLRLRFRHQLQATFRQFRTLSAPTQLKYISIRKKLSVVVIQRWSSLWIFLKKLFCHILQSRAQFWSLACCARNKLVKISRNKLAASLLKAARRHAPLVTRNINRNAWFEGYFANEKSFSHNFLENYLRKEHRRPSS